MHVVGAVGEQPWFVRQYGGIFRALIGGALGLRGVEPEFGDAVDARRAAAGGQFGLDLILHIATQAGEPGDARTVDVLPVVAELGHAQGGLAAENDEAADHGSHWFAVSSPLAETSPRRPDGSFASLRKPNDQDQLPGRLKRH